jgi:hypothetical protein
VAKVAATLFEQRQSVRDPDSHYYYGIPRDVVIPEWPKLPLAGLLWEGFKSKTDVEWCCENIKASGKLYLYLWLYLPMPLGCGGSVACWLASPFEPISQQVLVPGLTLEWWFAGGQIGELVVEKQFQMPASEFFEWFGFDKPYRDTGREFSEWLQSVRRGGRRR